MELDEHQRAEFENHYSDTYLKWNDRKKGTSHLVYCMQGGGGVPGQVAVCKVAASGRNGEPFAVSTDDLELFTLESGYYNVGNGTAIYFSRIPLQHQRRGLSRNNSRMYLLRNGQGNIALESFRLEPKYLYHIFQNNQPKLDFVTEVKKIVEGASHSYCLSKDIALFAGEVSNARVCLVLYKTAPIAVADEQGFWVPSNREVFKQPLEDLKLAKVNTY